MITLGNHERLDIELPDGRIMRLWCADCGDHVSVDISTSRGREHEDVSAHTGDTTRAPMGVFAWARGRRACLLDDDYFKVDPHSHGWVAVSTVTVLWDKEGS